MKYKRINDATVQCIISKEDMEEFGLTISDIFERNERGEDFLRRIISNACDEVGYEINGGNIAMQITPLQDRGLMITFSDEGPASFQNLLEHIKNVLSGTGLDLQKIVEQLHGQTDGQDRSGNQDPASVNAEPENIAQERVFAFSRLEDVISFCRAAYGEQRMGSQLYKEGETYYLVLIKKRISWKDFNRLSVQAFDFAEPLQYGEDLRAFLEEHGDCLIERQAVGKLKKMVY